MATLQQVLDDVTAEKTGIDSLSALIVGLRQQLSDALAGVALPPAVQAQVDAIFAVAEENRVQIANALAANTQSTAAPSAPSPAPAPDAPAPSTDAPANVDAPSPGQAE